MVFKGISFNYNYINIYFKVTMICLFIYYHDRTESCHNLYCGTCQQSLTVSYSIYFTVFDVCNLDHTSLLCALAVSGSSNGHSLFCVRSANNSNRLNQSESRIEQNQVWSSAYHVALHNNNSVQCSKCKMLFINLLINFATQM